jgi:abequosyltransferase
MEPRAVSLQDQPHGAPEPVKLSICIATYKRGAYIGDTLEAIIAALPAGVEVVIVDGASPDNTTQVVESFVRRNRAVRYFRETTNSGVDRDFDKAVCYARGEYCWLMSDDDILLPGAVARVLEKLDTSLDLVVVNAQVRTVDLSVELNPRILKLAHDRDYDSTESDSFLGDAGGYLSFIGGVVIRRDRWLERERERYFGSLFIHAGVIFQAPLAHIRILAEPLIAIRFGNAMWSGRGFEIWMFKWPDLIWSFAGFSDEARQRVVAREPWRKLRKLFLFRGLGGYSYAEYRRFFADERRGGLLQLMVASFPAAAANGLGALFWFIVNREAREGIHDLAHSRNSNFLTRWIAGRLGIPLR